LACDIIEAVREVIGTNRHVCTRSMQIMLASTSVFRPFGYTGLWNSPLDFQNSMPDILYLLVGATIPQNVTAVIPISVVLYRKRISRAMLLDSRLNSQAEIFSSLTGEASRKLTKYQGNPCVRTKHHERILKTSSMRLALPLTTLILRNSGPFLQIIAALLLLTACTFIIASPQTNEAAKHFAYTTVGVLICIIWPQCKHPQCRHKHR